MTHASSLEGFLGAQSASKVRVRVAVRLLPLRLAMTVTILDPGGMDEATLFLHQRALV